MSSKKPAKPVAISAVMNLLKGMDKFLLQVDKRLENTFTHLDDEFAKIVAELLAREARTRTEIEAIHILLTERCDKQDEQIDRLIEIMGRLTKYVDTVAQNVLERSIRRDVRTPTITEVPPG